MKSRWMAAVLGVLGGCFLAGEARAEGLLLSSAGARHPSHSDVQIEVFEQVATTTTEMTFPEGGEGVSQLAFDLPEGASAVGVALFRDGQWQDAQISGQDAPATPTTPAPSSQPKPSSGQVSLYLGANPFLMNLPAQGSSQVKVRLTYIQLLTSEMGEIRSEYPLRRASFRPDEPTDTTLTIRFQSSRPILGHSAPGYGAAEELLGQGSDWRQVRYRLGSVVPQKPFVFRYGLESSPKLVARLLTHHERCSQDGFFLLILEPPSEVKEEQVIPKYFSFVMDTSGSMAGTKMIQAKAGAQAGVALLGPKDRFNVTAYSSGVDSLFPAPVLADATNRGKASAFIENQWPEGGTNIHDALLESLSAGVAPGFARVLVMLTDGNPTAGETHPSTIVKNVKAANLSETRLFTFGIGPDVNHQLLKDLAVSNGGEARFVGDNDDIQEELARLFQWVSRPVLTDATVSFQSVKTGEVYPDGPRDLFAGSQLLVLGRYSGGGPTQAALDGTLFDAPEHQEFSVEFPACAQDNPFLPRLWAKSKIDTLLARIAELGFEDPDLVRQIEELGTTYGIQTPYSSFDLPIDAPEEPSHGSGNSGSYGSGNSGSYGSGNSNDYGSGSPSSYSGGALDTPGCQASSGPPRFSSGLSAFALAALGALRLRRRQGR